VFVKKAERINQCNCFSVDFMNKNGKNLSKPCNGNNVAALISTKGPFAAAAASLPHRELPLPPPPPLLLLPAPGCPATAF
jgi:hypothetical protein